MLLLLSLLACPGPKAPDTATDTGPTCPPAPWATQPAGEPLDGWPGEGVAAVEEADARAVAGSMLADPGVAAVFWREEGTDVYRVVGAATEATFTRTRDADANWTFSWSGDAPLWDDPTAVPTLAEELAAGSNPAGTSYPDQGYDAGDVRLSFLETAEASFPFLAPRIAQIFDAADAPDLGWVLAPYAAGGLGTHGNLSAAQSRAPLVLRGPGVVAGTWDVEARLVDVAPTVAGVLGVAEVEGVDGLHGIHRPGLMLAWQDGRVLDEILDGGCAYGAASYAVVFVFDGLSHTELRDAVETWRLPNFARVADGSHALLGFGAVTGWPSLSLPGHVTVHTGTWSGHHGMLSNDWIHRADGLAAPGADLSTLLASASDATAAMDTYLSPDVETLFEAVGRSFPGALTASINELTFRGATWSRLGGTATKGPADSTDLADEAGVAQAVWLFDEEGPPRYLAMSFYVTDTAGQDGGPHGDGLREALQATDERLGRVLDLYEDAGIFDQTLFVITADHGMELQDASRTADPTGALSASGVALTSPGGGLVYFAE